MSLTCGISGEVAETPVVSKKTGNVYEKSLIIKHIQSVGTDPVTGEEMTLDDLVELQTVNKPVRPRAPQVTSLGSLLKVFQNEWDSVLLETYTLKQHLDTVRQQLSHALYQHDAACRVIARLIQERDRAKAALVDTRTNMREAVSEVSASAMDTEDAGIPEDIIKSITDFSRTISKARKKRFKKGDFSGLASTDDVGAFTEKQSHSPHSASNASVNCVDVHRSQQDRVVSGGQDGQVVVFERTSGKITHKLEGHQKAVTDVVFHPTQDLILSTSEDSTAIVWAADKGKYSVGHRITAHEKKVSGLSLHASGNYFVTASSDASWAFHDIGTGACLRRVQAESNITLPRLHPDGVLLATGGVDNIVRVWDLKSQTNVASFEHKTQGPISALSFSENGFILASADTTGVVKLWDLRRELTTLANLQPGGSVHSLAFDPSNGSFLAAAHDGGVVVYNTKSKGRKDQKSWDHVIAFTGHSEPATGVVFGNQASFLTSSSLDGTVKFWA